MQSIQERQADRAHERTERDAEDQVTLSIHGSPVAGGRKFRKEAEREKKLLGQTVASANAFLANGVALTLFAIGTSRQAVGVDAAKPTGTAIGIKSALFGRRCRVFNAGTRCANLTDCACGPRHTGCGACTVHAVASQGALGIGRAKRPY